MSEETEVVPRRCENTDWRRKRCTKRSARKMWIFAAGSEVTLWVCEDCAVRLVRQGWCCVRTRRAEEASS